MSKSVLNMSMSLDGFVAGPDDGSHNPGGDGFMRLHQWFCPDGEKFVRPDGPAGELFDEFSSSGALLSGRRTAEQVNHWNGDAQGVPIFVVSHRPPDPSVAAFPKVTYVLDGMASAMAQAKAAAGDKTVLIHGGAEVLRTALEAGVLDEIQIHQIPVLFGQGRRLFDGLSSRIELEIVRTVETPDATHIRYRVRR